MEYFEILNDFFSNNKIDPSIVPYIIELFELNRNVVFLGEENRNLSDLYKLDDINLIKSNRSTFIELENKKLEKFISELKSLKTVTNEESYGLIDELISDKERFKERIDNKDFKEENIDEYKRLLVYNFENNRRKILLSCSKIKDLESKFEKLNKKELYDDLNDVLNSLKIKSRFDSEDSFLVLLSKLEEEKGKLDLDYLKSLGLDNEIEEITNYRDKIFNKEDAIKYLNIMLDLSIKHSRPLLNNQNMLNIAALEQRLFLKNIYSYFDKIKEHPELKPYYILLENQISDLNKDVTSEKDQEKYLNNILSIFETTDSLNINAQPLKVERAMLNYDASHDVVKTILLEKDMKFVEYKKGDSHLYSIVENREVIQRDLDYWKKELDFGFDRYDKGDFYKEVYETLNLLKFYYRFKNYVVYSEVSNKSFNIPSSIEMTNKDKTELDTFRRFINEKMDSLRTRGIDYWKEENNPNIYFSKKSEIDQEIIFKCIIPENGIGREISTSEMLKSIYGKELVESTLKTLEDKKEKK